MWKKEPSTLVAVEVVFFWTQGRFFGLMRHSETDAGLRLREDRVTETDQHEKFLVLDLQADALHLAGPAHRLEKISQQGVGVLEGVGLQHPDPPELVAVIVLDHLPACRMLVVVSQQPFPIHVMEGERVAEAVRPLLGSFDTPHAEPEAPTVRQPIAPPMIGEQAFHRFVRHISYHDINYQFTRGVGLLRYAIATTLPPVSIPKLGAVLRIISAT